MPPKQEVVNNSGPAHLLMNNIDRSPTSSPACRKTHDNKLGGLVSARTPGVFVRLRCEIMSPTERGGH